MGEDMTFATKPWDADEFLATGDDIRHYLEAAFEEADPALIRHAFNTVARARGALQGVRRERESDAGYVAQGDAGVGG